MLVHTLNSTNKLAIKLHTEVSSNYDSKFIGCVGEISYRILGDVEPIAIKQINALANFALYAGVGRKTTMGMGMTRRLSIANLRL